MANVAAQVERLTQAFLRGARGLGIDSKTPSASVGPLVVLRSTDPAAVVEELAARGILVSARRDGVRFAFHVYNTMGDVNVALAAIDELSSRMVRA